MSEPKVEFLELDRDSNSRFLVEGHVITVERAVDEPLRPGHAGEVAKALNAFETLRALESLG